MVTHPHRLNLILLRNTGKLKNGHASSFTFIIHIRNLSFFDILDAPLKYVVMPAQATVNAFRVPSERGQLAFVPRANVFATT